MKRILPILTAALALTAMTASAATTYSSFSEFIADTSYGNTYVSDAPTVTTENGVQIINYGKYSVIKQVSNLPYQTHFKIRANETINFYISDYVADLYGTNSGTSLGDLVANIGYSTTGEKPNTHGLGTPADSVSVAIPTDGMPDNKAVRNSYYLGTFTKGKEYDIFLQRDGEKGSWSWQNADGSLDSGYPLYTDTTTETPASATTGGVLQIDTLMAAYLDRNPNVNVYNANVKLAVTNAMPLAMLNGVTFGMYATPAADNVVAGSPLPGGVQIALIAGLFGLGFWYIRRRKAIAA